MNKNDSNLEPEILSDIVQEDYSLSLDNIPEPEPEPLPDPKDKKNGKNKKDKAKKQPKGEKKPKAEKSEKASKAPKGDKPAKAPKAEKKAKAKPEPKAQTKPVKDSSPKPPKADYTFFCLMALGVVTVLAYPYFGAFWVYLASGSMLFGGFLVYQSHIALRKTQWLKQIQQEQFEQDMSAQFVQMQELLEALSKDQPQEETKHSVAQPTVDLSEMQAVLQETKSTMEQEISQISSKLQENQEKMLEKVQEQKAETFKMLDNMAMIVKNQMETSKEQILEGFPSAGSEDLSQHLRNLDNQLDIMQEQVLEGMGKSGKISEKILEKLMERTLEETKKEIEVKKEEENAPEMPLALSNLTEQGLKTSLSSAVQFTLESTLHKILGKALHEELEDALEEVLEKNLRHSLDDSLDHTFRNTFQNSFQSLLQNTLETTLSATVEEAFKEHSTGNYKAKPVETPKKETTFSVLSPESADQLQRHLQENLGEHLQSVLSETLRNTLGYQIQRSLEEQLEDILLDRLGDLIQQQLQSQLEPQLQVQLQSQLKTQLEYQLETQLKTQLLSQVEPLLQREIRALSEQITLCSSMQVNAESTSAPMPELDNLQEVLKLAINTTLQGSISSLEQEIKGQFVQQQIETVALLQNNKSFLSGAISDWNSALEGLFEQLEQLPERITLPAVSAPAAIVPAIPVAVPGVTETQVTANFDTDELKNLFQQAFMQNQSYVKADLDARREEDNRNLRDSFTTTFVRLKTLIEEVQELNAKGLQDLSERLYIDRVSFEDSLRSIQSQLQGTGNFTEEKIAISQEISKVYKDLEEKIQEKLELDKGLLSQLENAIKEDKSLTQEELQQHLQSALESQNTTLLAQLDLLVQAQENLQQSVQEEIQEKVQQSASLVSESLDKFQEDAQKLLDLSQEQNDQDMVAQLEKFSEDVRSLVTAQNKEMSDIFSQYDKKNQEIFQKILTAGESSEKKTAIPEQPQESGKTSVPSPSIEELSRSLESTFQRKSTKPDNSSPPEEDLPEGVQVERSKNGNEEVRYYRNGELLIKTEIYRWGILEYLVTYDSQGRISHSKTFNRKGALCQEELYHANGEVRERIDYVKDEKRVERFREDGTPL